MAKELKMLSNEELWQLFPIIISEYKDDWKDKYNEEKEKLCLWIGNSNIYRINHIGSTAVKNLLAKPTIDILLEINKNVDTENLIKILEAKNYIYSPQPDNPPPHMMFMKGYTASGFKGQAYHLHIRYPDDWNEFYFRDYLLENSKTAKEYGNMKLELAEKYRNNRDGYTEAKTDFICKITALAKEKYKNRYVIIP